VHAGWKGVFDLFQDGFFNLLAPAVQAVEPRGELPARGRLSAVSRAIPASASPILPEAFKRGRLEMQIVGGARGGAELAGLLNRQEARPA